MYKLLTKIGLLFLCISCASSKDTTQKDFVFKNETARSDYAEAYNQSLKLWKIPYTEDDITTSLGNAHVIVTGPKNGNPVVLIHGMDASSTMWYPNIQALSKNNRVYAIDFLMEVGKSQATEKTLSKEEIAGWYNEVFDHYNLKKFSLIGASKGGWIATMLASKNQDRVDKLILLSPAQTFQNIDQAGKASAALFLKFFPSKRKLNKTLKAFSFYPERIDPIYKNQFYLANKYAKSNSSFLQMNPFSNDDLKNLNVPVLVMVGDHDIINSKETLEKADKFLPKSKTATIKNAGHFLSIDQSQAVNQMMVDFLN